MTKRKQWKKQEKAKPVKSKPPIPNVPYPKWMVDPIVEDIIEKSKNKK